MPLNLEIRYDCAAKEEAFLGTGWGLRDVRGPYLIADVGTIRIPNWLLHERFSTTVTISFSLSNRCKNNVVLVSVGLDGEVNKVDVQRNCSSSITFEDVFVKSNMKVVEFTISACGQYVDLQRAVTTEIKDLLAVDGVSLSRNLLPSTIRY